MEGSNSHIIGKLCTITGWGNVVLHCTDQWMNIWALGTLNQEYATWLRGYERKEHCEEILEIELWSSGHGSGVTFFEEPDTLEQTHDVDESKAREKEILERHIEVKGDSLIPEK